MTKTNNRCPSKTRDASIPENWKTIGGTTISAILGASRWQSPRGAYYALRGEVPPKVPNSAMERGIRYEDVVARTFSANHPEYRVIHNTQVVNPKQDGFDAQERVYDAERPYFSGSPDRLLFPATFTDVECTDEALTDGLEIKTASIQDAPQWGEENTDQIPEAYLWQVVWYMSFYPNCQRWHIAVEFFNYDDKPCQYREYVVKRTTGIEKCIQEARRIAESFWTNNVLAGVEPESDRVDDYVRSYIDELYPEDVNPIETATDKEESLIQRYMNAKRSYEVAKEELASVQALLEESIGDRSGVDSPYGKATWRLQNGRKTTDWKAICEELQASAEVIERHTKQGSPYRTFRFYPKKD